MNILLHLKSPMQSWGDTSHSMTGGTKRGSYPFPSYSGVLGLIANCMGINRDRESTRFEELFKSFKYVGSYPRKPIEMITDFQTMGSGYDGSHEVQRYMGKRSAGGSIRATGYVEHPRLVDGKEVTLGKLTHRDYIEDNEFMVIVNIDDSIAEKVVKALKNPKWIPVLGRSSCIPSSRILHSFGKSVEDLVSEMKNYWSVSDTLMAFTSEPPTGRYSRLDAYDVPSMSNKFKYHKRWLYKSFI